MPALLGQRQEFRSVVIGQGRCPGGEAFEVPAAFIQALAFELVHGHGIGLLLRGRSHSLPV